MDIFYAIAEPTRRNIIEMLAKKGRLSATDIGEKFSMSAPAISQHLKEKQGQQRMYHLNLDKVYEFEVWAHEMTKVWNKRFDKLDKLLKAKNNKINYGK